MSRLTNRLHTYIKNNPLNTILAVTLLAEIIIALFHGLQVWPDTGSYITTADNLSHGEINVERTPGFPMLILLAGLISESAKLWIVAAFQIILFLLSTACFFKLAGELKLSKTIVIAATCLYIISTQLIAHCMTITSEPLAISLSVFFICYFFRWYRSNSLKSYLIMLLLSVSLIFTRPSFLYIPVALGLITVVYLSMRQYMRALLLILCIAVNILLMMGYCKMVEAKIGVYTPTVVSIVNDSCIALRAGIFKSDNVENPEIKERLITFEHRRFRNSVWDYPDLRGITHKDLYDAIEGLKGESDLSWYQTAIKVNLRDFMRAPVVTLIPSRYLNGVNIFLTFGQLCIVMLVIAAGLIMHRCKSGVTPLYSIFLWLMCAGNIAVNILGSFAEWARLFAPSLPLFILLCGELCNRLRITYIKGKPFA